MPTLSPLAVALQGIGFATHLTALQGLVAVEETVTPPFRGVVITRAYLEAMRARRLALAPKRREREKTKREADEELEEIERVQTAQAARAARLAAEAAAKRDAAALIGRLAANRGAAEVALLRRKRQQQLIALLATH